MCITNFVKKSYYIVELQSPAVSFAQSLRAYYLKNPCILQFLNLELPFDEAHLIEENREFLQRTLKLDVLNIKDSDGSVIAGAAGRNQDRAEPGQPVIVFLKQ